MLPKGIIDYTTFDLERMAAELLRRRVDIKPDAPINMELLVENTRDVELEIRSGLLYQHKVEGCVCKQGLSRTLTVMVDWTIYKDPSWGPYYAVLGEEFAHIHLHQSLLLLVNSVEDFLELQADPQWRRYERDAKRFSLAIRMPPHLVDKHASEIYRRIVTECGFEDAVRIEKLVRNQLAELFRVPVDDAFKRMSEWPCNTRTRILNSVQTGSLELLPDDWVVTASPPEIRQPTLW